MSIQGAFTEEPTWSDNTPEYATVKMHPSYRTSETVDGLWSAEARNVEEHPVENTNLCQARDNGSHHLDIKEKLWRDLHVMTELEVGGEFNPLCRTDVAVGHKNHVRHGTTGEDDTANELADEVKAAVLIGDGHDNSHG